MEVLLDTNFIISCVKKKIDFISGLEEKGFRILLPKEVYEELKDLRLDSSPKNRAAIEVALELMAKRKVEKIGLGKKKVDEALIESGRKGRYIATLDAAVKRSVPNRVVISESSNDLIIERD